jgi:hypothetical protein
LKFCFFGFLKKNLRYNLHIVKYINLQSTAQEILICGYACKTVKQIKMQNIRITPLIVLSHSILLIQGPPPTQRQQPSALYKLVLAILKIHKNGTTSSL